MSEGRADTDDPVVCFCNEVRLSQLVDALDAGASSLAELYDLTWAGCGPCGGTCQPDIAAILNDWLGSDQAGHGPATDEGGADTKATGSSG